MHYSARSLEDIAKIFEEKSKVAAAKANMEQTKIDQARCRRESVTWASAAHILRNTVLTPEVQ